MAASDSGVESDGPFAGRDTIRMAGQSFLLVYEDCGQRLSAVEAHVRGCFLSIGNRCKTVTAWGSVSERHVYCCILLSRRMNPRRLLSDHFALVFRDERVMGHPLVVCCPRISSLTCIGRGGGSGSG